MSVVVSDTSPIRALHHVRLMPVLQEFFGAVLVPPLVARELAEPRGRYLPLTITQYPFIEVRVPQSLSRVTALDPKLQMGEIQALSLALEFEANFLLMDELAGRAVARQLGLRTTGVLGLLTRAKEIGKIHEVRPLMDELRTGLRFFIHDALYAEVLRRNGEI